MLSLRMKNFFEKLLMKKKIESSMGLQFMLSLALAVSMLMIPGALFVQQMLVDNQYHHMTARGSELAVFLGKAGTDAVERNDMDALDALVAEAADSRDVLFVHVADVSGRVLNSPRSVFNRSSPMVRAFLAEETIDSTAALVSKARSAMDVLEIHAPITGKSGSIGTVTIGFSREAARQAARRIVLLLVCAGIIIVGVLSAIVYWMVRRMIVLPTRQAVMVASNIASGDLTESMRVRSVDELGNLGRGLNRMIVGLKSMIGSVREAARKMENVWTEVRKTSGEITSGSRTQFESVEEAASSVNEMHYSLKEMAATVDELSASSEHTSSSVAELATSIAEVDKTMSGLSASIEETATAITQMSTAIRQIAENVESLSTAVDQTSASSLQISSSVKEVESAARESASIAEEVAEDARTSGMRAIEKTIEGMRRIESNAQRGAEIINRLGERAESIGGILTVIEDITDQTGLLALNAAILAAQAGEHGKGFSVVAAEVRELANRTAGSTQEIAKLIASVQDESRQAIEAMKEGDGIVKDGVRLATDAGRTLAKIVERAGASRDMSRSINKAAEEQARGIRQVSDAVQQINKMAHHFAGAAREQKSGSEQIMRASERMREITNFVKTSTGEQARAGKDIAASVEQMNARIMIMNRAAREVQASSELIIHAIDRIKEIAKTNVDMAAGLNAAMDVMSGQSGILIREIANFRIEKRQTGGENPADPVVRQS